MDRNKKLELICIAIVIAFSLLSFLFTKVLGQRHIGYTKVSIHVGSDTVWISDIKDLTDKKLLVYEKDDGTCEVIDDIEDTQVIKERHTYNVVMIKDKKLSCIEANCPNQVCVHHGTLRDDIDNDMIVCAPHRMTILYQ